MIPSHILDGIAAKTWWLKNTNEYPYQIVMVVKANKEIHAQWYEELTKKRNFITSGIVNGGRVWGFKTAQDRHYFHSHVAEQLVQEQYNAN